MNLQFDTQGQLAEFTKLQHMKEQELKMATLQRQKQLENILRQRDSRIKDQDVGLQGMSKQIQQLQQEVVAQQNLIDQYESRFVQVRDILETKDREHKGKVQEFESLVTDLQSKSSRFQSQNAQLEQERAKLNGQIKDVLWQSDQEQKKLMREVQKVKDSKSLDESEYLSNLTVLKQDVAERFSFELQAKDGEIMRLETGYIERIGDLNNEVALLVEQLRQKESLIQDQRLQLNDQNRKVDMGNYQLVKVQGDYQKKCLDLEILVNRISNEKDQSEQSKTQVIQDLQKQVQELTLSKEQNQQQLMLLIDTLKYESQIAQQKHELEINKYTKQSGTSLQHFQDMLAMSQEEVIRLKEEVELLQRSLRDQEEMGRREQDEMRDYQKGIVNNYDKQMREFKTQLQFKNKEIMALREENNNLQQNGAKVSNTQRIQSAGYASYS